MEKPVVLSELPPAYGLEPEPVPGERLPVQAGCLIALAVALVEWALVMLFVRWMIVQALAVFGR